MYIITRFIKNSSFSNTFYEEMKLAVGNIRLFFAESGFLHVHLVILFYNGCIDV